MLQGIRVVELGTYIAAPGACALLADYGADVIKVESRHGDPIRQFFTSVGREGEDHNRLFETDNRGKRSIVLDVSTGQGAQEMRALLATADVFVTNARPGSLARVGLDWESLKAFKPDLIYVGFTGFGTTGPEAEKPGFDITAFWARTGLCSLATAKGGEPVQLRTGIGDHMAALALVAGVMGALYHRERTGEGQKVETSLIRIGAYAGAAEHAVQLQLGKLASTKGRKEGVNPLNNFFQTGDGRWFVTVPRQGGGDWPRLLRAAGRPELLEDPRFDSFRNRRANAAALIDEFDAAFAAVDFEAAAAALDREDLIWGPVLTIAQAARDPQARAAGCFVDLTDDDGNRFEVVAGPIDFEQVATRGLRRAPMIGEHGDTVREEILLQSYP
jgi:crotonobetainyl-CoA:carnitine CoA-transferase CaiB-like acyl-CoA transferase